jgi:hypothetical protein
MSEEHAANDKYHLSLQGPGITIDTTVDRKTAGAIAQMTFGGSAAPPPQGQGGMHRPLALASSAQKVSLREYLQGSAPDRGIHTKILAVARYMRDIENQSDFTREDVRARFRSAGEPQPANFHRDFQKAVRAAWIAEDHQNRGRFYVTRTGDDAIDRRQEYSPAVASSRSRPKNRRSAVRLATEQ